MPLAVVPTLTASLPYSRSPDLHCPPGQQELPGAPAKPCSPREALLPIRWELEDLHRIQIHTSEFYPTPISTAAALRCSYPRLSYEHSRYDSLHRPGPRPSSTFQAAYMALVDMGSVSRTTAT